MQNKRESFAGTVARKMEEIWDGEKPGLYLMNPGVSKLYYICPCGCGELNVVPVDPGPKREGAWWWDGNVEKPTVQPSIRRLNGCHFHGHLTAGIWSFAGDSGKKRRE